MVDIHAHILPGVDDGPNEWDKSLKMLHRASQDGITAIVATPHVVPGGYDNTRDKVAKLTGELKARNKDLELEIYPGSELVICPDTLAGLEQDLYCTLNFTRYVLVELPAGFDPQYVNDFLSSLAGLGLVPVIAHPERNDRLLREGLDTLYEMVALGSLVQVTAGSISGLFGGAVKSAVREMLQKRLAHVIASDAHSIGKRPPVMSKGVGDAARLIGDRAARAMAEDIPRTMIENGAFEVQEPLYSKKRFVLF